MNFEEFIVKQESIYKRFKDTTLIEKDGIVPKIPLQQGGYLIAYRHPIEITNKLSIFSERVGRIIPALTYNKKNAHTSISDYQVADNFSPDNSVLQSLSMIVSANLPSGKVEINYNEWLLNQNTGIVAGIPNSLFFENARQIVENAAKESRELRLPWGAHITVNRFLKTSKEYNEISELLKVFKESPPLGISIPKNIDVGHFILTPEEFRFEVSERFKL